MPTVCTRRWVSLPEKGLPTIRISRLLPTIAADLIIKSANPYLPSACRAASVGCRVGHGMKISYRRMDESSLRAPQLPFSFNFHR
jgi:hypothetical protein